MPEGTYLLEVRCEEIPARMLEPAVQELASLVSEELMALGIGPREVTGEFTPRRLVLVLEGLPRREPDKEEEVVGPPARAAFAKDGSPTKALLGFARRCGVDAESLERVTKDKGEYVVARKAVPGRPTAEVLAELVPRVLTGLSWPKTMSWAGGTGPWVRPVHGLVSLLDGEVVSFELFGVSSGRSTCGHPVLSPQTFEVRDLEDYRARLSALGVEISSSDRRRGIAERMEALAAERDGMMPQDEELLARLAAMCEIPGVLAGDFDSAYLRLPREVLQTSLRDHQSAFTVERDGALLPFFLTVMDRPDDPEGHVRSGNEWVVAARLEDARFFYDEDRKVALAERAGELGRLTFHEKLGSYAAKADRLEALSEEICKELGWEDEIEGAVEAARLLKADLTTEMVKELTSLQGIMGGIYAREEGYPVEVWQALYDQYLPAAASDSIPRGRIGRVTALADRVDTLVGIFGIGLVPSGSKDPFGLRRAAQGALRILLEGEMAVDLTLLAARAARLYGDRLTKAGEEILQALRPFFHDRLRFLLGREGFAYDEVEAALAVGGSNLPDLRARVEAVHRVREEPHFLDMVLAAKRIANIVRDAPDYTLAFEDFEDPSERELYAAFLELREDIDDAVAQRDHEGALRRIVDLAEVLERFFVEVLVMAEDPRLRANRIALLQTIQRAVSRTAQLTEVVVDKADYRARGGSEIESEGPGEG